MIIEKIGEPPLPKKKTCDHLMTEVGTWKQRSCFDFYGNQVDVIRQASTREQIIITHNEPTWFSGADDTEWLSDDPVYLEKKKLIEEHKIAISFSRPYAYGCR